MLVAKKSLASKFTSALSIVALVLGTSFAPMFAGLANAASISSSKATFGRLAEDINSESGIVQFASPTGIQNGSDTITLTFSGEFVLAAEVAANFDVELGNSSTCSSASYTDEIVALTASGTDWGVDVTGNVITFTPHTGETLTAGNCLRLIWGTAATFGGTGAAGTVVNATDVDDDDTITIGGVFGDTGTITVDIIDSDQVTVSATVNQTLTFDLDTGTSEATENSSYSVALGTLSTGSVTRSNTSTVNMIIIEGATNASGGLNVTVQNANGANGLVSTSTPTDMIANSAAPMSAGNTNYGLCVDTVGITGFTRASPYNSGTCTINGGTNDVLGLTTTPVNIVTSSGVLSSGHAVAVVNAAISGSVPAHADYADTLTFIGTATF
jgi:hypothetical protein